MAAAKHVQDAETQITLQRTAFTSTKRSESPEKSVTWQTRNDLWNSTTEGKGSLQEGQGEATVQVQSKRVGIVVRTGTCLPSVPRTRSMR